MTKRLTLSLLLLFLLSLPAMAQDTATFVGASCPDDLNLPFGFEQGIHPGAIECGYVEVPEFHADPDGNTIRVSVAVIHSLAQNPLPDPLFMEEGGPGGSTFETFFQLAPLFQTNILMQRDIILVEQRGTKYSDPHLDCPEFTDLAIEYISQGDFETEDVLATERETYRTCFHRLETQGVNLAAFNSVENAADIISVADALGYGDINFYGVSYGTMLGQHLLRDHEERIRSIVFDSVVPLELNFVPDIMATGMESRMELFNACAADELCNSLYPDLETVFWETYEELNANPILIPTTDPETGIEYEAYIDGDTMMQLLRSMQYSTAFIPALPAFIYDASEGNYEWIEWVYGLLFIDGSRNIADAMYVSVICGEDADFTIDDVNTEGIRDDVLEANLPTITSIQGACEVGNIPALDDYVDDPVVSDVPALLTSGQFDPITPPRYGDVLHGNFSNSTHVIFPGVGHGAVLGGTCPVNIMNAFVNNPGDELDTSCVDDMSPSFSELATDPTDSVRFPVPQGFTELDVEGYASYEDESGDIIVSFMGVDVDDINEAVHTALTTIIAEDFDAPALVEVTQESGFGGDLVQNIYQDGADLVAIIAVEQDGLITVIVIEFPVAQLLTIDPLLQAVANTVFPVD